MDKCDCHSWASDGQFAYAMTGHHARCPKLDQEKLLRDTERMLFRLVEGIEAWGRQEDGVPEEVWDAYKLACLKLGKISSG